MALKAQLQLKSGGSENEVDADPGQSGCLGCVDSLWVQLPRIISSCMRSEN